MIASRQRRFGLTPAQATCLEAIQTHLRQTGTMPSVSELRAALGVASKSGVHQLLRQLESRGAIKRARGRARAIRITTHQCPRCGEELR
jgi:repressor LexA